jgi:hypothetical protein
MGLDYSIGVRIKRRKTNDEIANFEIAYWRKFWSLRSETMRVAMADEDKVIKYDADWLLEVKPEVLEDIIECLTSAVADRNDELHSDSIWGSVHGRQITLRQLMRLCPWDNLFARFEDILAEDMLDGSREAYLDDIADILADIKEDSEFPNDLDLKEILMTLEEYEFSLEIINSY